jgi:hypothetical protein
MTKKEKRVVPLDVLGADRFRGGVAMNCVSSVCAFSRYSERQSLMRSKEGTGDE